jgi:predicted ester cyclase
MPRQSGKDAHVSLEENKNLIHRYLSAIDANHADNWDVLDNYIAEDFVAHHAPAPGVTLDRAGMKQSAEIFRVGAPGSHEIVMQVAEGDLVVSYIRGSGVHAGELFGIPATNKSIETEGIAIHRVRNRKIVEY